VISLAAERFTKDLWSGHAAKPPAGRDWVHEIKYDGYRLMVRGASPLVRLSTEPTASPQ
jgi:ATP-dependent DNA ligase